MRLKSQHFVSSRPCSPHTLCVNVAHFFLTIGFSLPLSSSLPLVYVLVRKLLHPHNEPIVLFALCLRIRKKTLRRERKREEKRSLSSVSVSSDGEN